MNRSTVSSIALVASCGLFFFVTGQWISQRALGPSGPRAELYPTKLDLGTVNVGQSVMSTLILRNTGQTRLLVTDVKSSCQCTVLKLESRALEPGASEPVKVEFKATILGSKYQRVILDTNDAEHPWMAVSLVANAVDRTDDMQR